MTKVYSIILTLGACVLALDQWTKQWAMNVLQIEGSSQSFLSWWSFTLVHNYGAAFGMFRNLPESVRLVFLLLLPVGVVALLWWFYVRKLQPTERLAPAAMGLVFGGAVGNFLDRLKFGYVIDFIDWFYPSQGSCLPQFHKFTPDTCHWPVFNVADTAINIAMGLLIIHSFLRPHSVKAPDSVAS